MATKKSYYIKERWNPQFEHPYYHLCGQLSKREAKRKENSLYGCNVMLEFSTLEEYENKIKELKDEKRVVHA